MAGGFTVSGAQPGRTDGQLHVHKLYIYLGCVHGDVLELALYTTGTGGEELLLLPTADSHSSHRYPNLLLH